MDAKMKKAIIFFILSLSALAFAGCSYATLKLVYSDARVVYQDAHYVVHEIQEAKK